MTTTTSRVMWPAPFVDQRGNRRAGLPITVYLVGKGPTPGGDGTLVKATLYTDDALTVVGANPVTTDADGNESSIKAAPGTYDAYVDGETIRILVIGGNGGTGAVASVDGQTGAVVLSGTYAPIAEVATRAAADTALGARIDGLGGGTAAHFLSTVKWGRA